MIEAWNDLCLSLSLSNFPFDDAPIGIDREKTEKKDGCRGVGTEEKWFLPFLFRRRRRDANVCRMQMWRRGAEVVGSRAGWLRYFPTSHTSRVSAPFNSRNRNTPVFKQWGTAPGPGADRIYRALFSSNIGQVFDV